MRLTIRNSDGTVSQPMNLDWAGALQKLAAYEDTGLEPEQIAEYLNATDEYVRASEEGRLIVLPCKIGDKVFRVVPKCIGPYIQCPFYGGHGLDRCYNCDTFIKEESFCLSMFEDIGKTVFLIREEAEAVLKGENDNV